MTPATAARGGNAGGCAVEPSEVAPLTTDDFTIQDEQEAGHRKIPKAKFIRSVEQFVGLQNPGHVEAVARELLMKYRYMEQAIQRQSEVLLAKIGDMEEALSAVKKLKHQKASGLKKRSGGRERRRRCGGTDFQHFSEVLRAICKSRTRKEKAKDAADPKEAELKTYFELADTLHAEAIIPPTDSVCLWLGANVVMEYSLDEAETLLTNNVETAKKTRAAAVEDLQRLRTQITVTEVNVARIHNYGVKKNQEAKGGPKTC
ncbi:putative prefoldin subunit 3 [Neospora caninum Liverpool]|uniref:Putative prefoldin subunit 3 n=1 Tax=Neospora caninum (strain Liverpool) TaxID=572307 RepID=F0VHH9_NEOCL|nr:putative prefoldin subunit 3 [Neospora caninum Liverpool]CBZ53173.1 putative prefoldin subunit 3 [Neospora caninum Liverpool]|eukprot:XP_003883205.1 putative prefoldin subunit 3 [Neospora caninum Liverpool]